MNRTLLFFFMIASLFVVHGCKEKGPHLVDKLSYTATLSANTVPVVANSEASGVAALEYSKSSGQLSYNLSLRGIKPTRIVIAFGDPNPWDAGPEIADITSQMTETGGSGSIVLDDYMEKGRLLSNYCYIRVDSEDYPYGELRGQIQLERED